jgi:hypothetical protein
MTAHELAHLLRGAGHTPNSALNNALLNKNSVAYGSSLY